jgi:flagellar hook-associated protein 1 FlgK
MVQSLLTNWQKPFATLSPNTLTRNNVNDYYISFMAGIANRGEQVNTISQNQMSMVNSIDNKRSEVTGVSSDEELTNLIKFQHSYNAAARYINVVSEMLEHIIMNL